MSVGSARPTIRFLSDPLIERILSEAYEVLGEVGVEVADPGVADRLLSGGATPAANGRLRLGAGMLDAARRTAPASFTLHGRDGDARADLGGPAVHFTPGSAAIRVLDGDTGEDRQPVTGDYVRYARLAERLAGIDYPSTAIVPSDVPAAVSDSYRLYLSLIYGTGPVVTGAFTVEGWRVMADLLLAVRGDARQLAAAPLAMFSCCSTAPLQWSEVTARNVVDCARLGIPVELISMPLTGFVAPGTLVGTLVQHTAENLSGLVISQLAAPGAPVAWGGSPAIFDYRHETTPVGAIESQMLECACAEIGRTLGLPTQGYVALSDSDRLDAQAGLETGSGALLAALAGVNSVSGPGMLDFQSCFSLEKLVVDAEICRAAQRVAAGVEPREGDFPAAPHFTELLREGHLLIADHTRRWFRRDVRFPGPVIQRASRARRVEEGVRTLRERARAEVAAHLDSEPALLDADRRRSLDEVMTRAARAAGMEALPRHGA